MKIIKIKVSYLISYDYKMFFTSVKLLYNEVDEIIVAIDRDYKTWSGNSFEIPDLFFDEVRAFDKKNKIQFYFDAFYISTLSPMECETRERNMVLEKMGHGWKIQLDVDEYIYDFSKLVKYLNKYWYLNLFPKLTPICFQGRLITLFRELTDGYLYIDNNEKFPFITNQSYNIHTRSNNQIRNHFSNINVIHQSWARTEEDIQFKIKNWGHRDDFDTEKYFQFWKSLDGSNYKEFQNFHPLNPSVWNKLYFLNSTSIDDFIKKYGNVHLQSLICIDYKKMFKALKNKFYR